MSLDKLQRRVIETAIGSVSFWALPEDAEATRPVLLVLVGAFMSLQAVDRLPTVLDDRCQVVLAKLPLRGAEAIQAPTAARMAEALGMATHSAFGGRPVVLVGFDDAGTMAARIASPEIVRVIAIEPILRSEKLWPVRSGLRRQVEAEPESFVLDYISDVYGVTREGETVRDGRIWFRAPRCPLEVIVGDRPLMPERILERAPSYVDDEDREWLAAQANVSVLVAPNAGHAIAREGGAFALDVFRRAIAEAPQIPLRPTFLARQLAGAAPRTARNVLYVGAESSAFGSAYLALNPKAAVNPQRAPDGGFDLVVLQDPGAGEFGRLNLRKSLAADGIVLALGRLGDARAGLERSLVSQGLAVSYADAVVTPQGSVLVRAQAAPVDPPCRVDIVPFAPLLMDIRTRLPADAMRADPALQINYYPPPMVLASTPDEPPRILILERPGGWSPDRWRGAAARAIKARQILVIEFDDHPELISQMIRGKSLDEGAWEMFRVAHGIQTSTEPLIDVFQAHNPEVRVFPNAVFDIQPFSAGERPRKVFYGGVTRGPFVVEVARSLGPAIEAHPDTEFVVMGDRNFFDALPTVRKSFRAYAAFDAYLAAMAECCISLSPLQARPMIETKSDAKYLDASRAGVLTIASPTVYERTIRCGENGLIARTMDDWPRMLELALRENGARERMARAAWDDVRMGRMFAYQTADRRDWYRSLLARREELDRAVLARCPEVASILAGFGDG